jgi:hypothetical protein
MDLVEVLAPFEAEKETTYGVRAGDVEAPSSPARQRERERKGKKEKALHDGDTSGFAATLAMNRSGVAGRRGGSGESSWRVVTAGKTDAQEDATSRHLRSEGQ